MNSKKQNRKAVDWKPQKIIFVIPPNSEESEIVINVQPKKGRAFAEVPAGTKSKFIKKPLTKAK